MKTDRMSKSYKPVKSKGDYPSVAASSGTAKWGQMASGSGVEQSTVVKGLKDSK